MSKKSVNDVNDYIDIIIDNIGIISTINVLYKPFIVVISSSNNTDIIL